ncbi:hypothetical protein [Actinomadura macrotermitis]|uniref:Uncharacterized protein n=1 Tax=Actinomadura macrotermitis TaxID=2585200 RepID=A0A7K0C8P4_9ACTN|nr:hypothetical protein [Actinomadura macrotermitis]MQY09825.1 hypothetical protein [Actinomadura macrotermitis]
MPIFPSDAPLRLGWPQRFHAVHRGREFRASSDELAAEAVLEPVTEPGAPGAPVRADGPGLRVDPAELDSWTRDWITFRWRGEPFVYRSHDQTAGVVAGDYTGGDQAFADAHLHRYGENSIGYVPLDEITDLSQEQEDLLAIRATEARALESLGPFTGDRTYLDRGEEFEPYALDGLWVKCRYLGRNYFVWAHWVLQTESSPDGGTTGFVHVRPSTLLDTLQPRSEA